MDQIQDGIKLFLNFYDENFNENHCCFFTDEIIHKFLDNFGELLIFPYPEYKYIFNIPLTTINKYIALGLILHSEKKFRNLKFFHNSEKTKKNGNFLRNNSKHSNLNTNNFNSKEKKDFESTPLEISHFISDEEKMGNSHLSYNGRKEFSYENYSASVPEMDKMSIKVPHPKRCLKGTSLWARFSDPPIGSCPNRGNFVGGERDFVPQNDPSQEERDNLLDLVHKLKGGLNKSDQSGQVKVQIPSFVELQQPEETLNKGKEIKEPSSAILEILEEQDETETHEQSQTSPKNNMGIKKNTIESRVPEENYKLKSILSKSNGEQSLKDKIRKKLRVKRSLKKVTFILPNNNCCTNETLKFPFAKCKLISLNDDDYDIECILDVYNPNKFLYKNIKKKRTEYENSIKMLLEDRLEKQKFYILKIVNSIFENLNKSNNFILFDFSLEDIITVQLPQEQQEQLTSEIETNIENIINDKYFHYVEYLDVFVSYFGKNTFYILKIY